MDAGRGRDRSPRNIACSFDASDANRSDRSRTISTIRAATTSDGSAANIFGRVGWTCTSPKPDFDAVPKEPPTVSTHAELISAFASCAGQARSYLSDLSDEAALATWRLVAGERELLAAPVQR